MKSLTLLTGTALIGFASCAANAADAAGEPGPREQRNPFPIDIAAAEARASERFTKIDTDGDGKVTPEEFSAAHLAGPDCGGPRGMHGPDRRGGCHHDPDDQDLAVDDPARAAHREAFQTRLAELDPAIFKGLDADGDGKLAPEEFSMAKVHATRQAVMRATMFKRLDKNSDGLLTKDELADPAGRLRAMDANGDGTVTRDEARAHRRAGQPSTD